MLITSVLLGLILVVLVASTDQFSRFFIDGRLGFAGRGISIIIVTIWLAATLAWIGYWWWRLPIVGGMITMIFILTLVRRIRISRLERKLFSQLSK
ncbi:MAG: hypothetical protein FJY67_08935 [Calditrichaeota bacterium]|nr:hypothetical protein [Calditrichota bacterium]